jgi:hypothetical protein
VCVCARARARGRATSKGGRNRSVGGLEGVALQYMYESGTSSGQPSRVFGFTEHAPLGCWVALGLRLWFAASGTSSRWDRLTRRLHSGSGNMLSRGEDGGGYQRGLFSVYSGPLRMKGGNLVIPGADGARLTTRVYGEHLRYHIWAGEAQYYGLAAAASLA